MTIASVDETTEAVRLAGRAGRTLDGPPAKVVRDPSLSAGTELGPYRVVRPLATGGQSRLYLVRHALHHEVSVLKVFLDPSRSDRERLAREARAQAALCHPHVVGVSDVVDVDGTPGLIMEYVDGPSLAGLLEHEGPPPFALAHRIATGLLAGLAAAHRAGFVHRDVKPSNVLLAPDADGYRTKLADFGLVRAVAGEREVDPAITQRGALLGTPAYMAPEQIRDATQADARSDVFSAGAVLYELVTGRRPFDGANVLDIYDQIRDQAWTPLHRLAPRVPARARWAIERALLADPARRFADCGAFLDAWRERLPGRTTAHAPQSLRWLVALATVAAGGLLWALADSRPSGWVDRGS